MFTFVSCGFVAWGFLNVFISCLYCFGVLSYTICTVPSSQFTCVYIRFDFYQLAQLSGSFWSRGE